MAHGFTRRVVVAVATGVAAVGLAGAVAVAEPWSAGGTPSVVGQVIVQDVEVPVPGQAPVQAYLVRSAGDVTAGSQAGVLWLHWLGQIHSDRTEFLAEAIQMASHGVVSLLPQGTFPWLANPGGTDQDVKTVERQLATFRQCLDTLFGNRYVDRARVAVVGHDYGAMYGALLADQDPRVSAAVLAAPDATWGHWFVKYWLGYDGQRAKRYDALFAHLQPDGHVARLGERELFQWAGQDIYVSPEVRREFAEADPSAHVNLFPAADHQMTTEAQINRDAFLKQVLALP